MIGKAVIGWFESMGFAKYYLVFPEACQRRGSDMGLGKLFDGSC